MNLLLVLVHARADEEDLAAPEDELVEDLDLTALEGELVLELGAAAEQPVLEIQEQMKTSGDLTRMDTNTVSHVGS